MQSNAHEALKPSFKVIYAALTALGNETPLGNHTRHLLLYPQAQFSIRVGKYFLPIRRQYDLLDATAGTITLTIQNQKSNPQQIKQGMTVTSVLHLEVFCFENATDEQGGHLKVFFTFK